MALSREEWLLLLGLWLLEQATGTPTPASTPQTNTTYDNTSNIPVTTATLSDPPPDVTTAVTSLPPNDITEETPLSLCSIDFTAREAHCDASRLVALPQVRLPDNITRLVVSRESIRVGGQFLGRALNDNNLTSLHNLERLTINRLGLSELQNATFAALPDLEYLDLARNRLRALHDVTFVGLNRLVTLNLSHNEISEIRPEMFNLPNLRHLVLAYNRLSALPTAAFKLLPLLLTLTLDGNDLGEMTMGGAFLGLDHLRELRLSQCNLEIAHSLFHHTHSIDTLYLDHNGLRNVPTEAISQLFLLQTLVLSHNKITSLSIGAFQGLAVRVLDLSNNSISKIAKLAFRSFRTEELYLQNNLLREVPRQAFESFVRNLFVLDLSGNNLDPLEVEFPDELTYLHTLNLSNTGLTHMPHSLRYLYQLHTLDVSDNLISALNETGVRLLRRLDSVSLQGNPWNCDCGIARLREWLLHHSERSAVAPPRMNASSVVCSGPDAVLAGTPVVAVPEWRLAHCARGWTRASPVAVYVICGVVVAGVLALGFFLWRKRHEMAYGRFCADKDVDNTAAGGGRAPCSPIKVISNAGAGARELPRHEDQHGPVKNQAWESALVISNPHSGQPGGQGDCCRPGPHGEQNGKVPGAETIV